VVDACVGDHANPSSSAPRLLPTIPPRAAPVKPFGRCPTAGCAALGHENRGSEARQEDGDSGHHEQALEGSASWAGERGAGVLWGRGACRCKLSIPAKEGIHGRVDEAREDSSPASASAREELPEQGMSPLSHQHCSEGVAASGSTSMATAAVHRRPLQLALFVIVGFLAYSNTFDAPFIFHDIRNIVENPAIHDLETFLTVAFGDAGDLGSAPVALPGTRKVAYLTFALNYRVHGLDVFGYHAVNLAIHLLNAILVYALVLVTLRTPRLRGSQSSRLLGALPFFSALLFVVHPIQTQAVTYIVQRLVSLATLFYLGSLLSYAGSRLYSGVKRYPPLACYVLSLACAVLAMQTKEIAFTLPLCLALYEFSFLRGPIGGRLLRLAPLLLTLLIIPLNLVSIDQPFGKVMADSDAVLRWGGENRLEYLMTQFGVIARYIRLLFLPLGQNLDYDIALANRFLDASVLRPFVGLSVLGGLAIILWLRSATGVNQAATASMRLIAFGILWFFLTLGVESSVMPIPDVIYEHRVYLPSVGALLAITTCVLWFGGHVALRWRPAPTAAAVVLLAAALTLSGMTYARNQLWRDPVGFWQDVIRKSPHKSRPYQNLGVVLIREKRLAEAKAALETAVERDPSSPLAHNSLGNVLMAQGQVEAAMEHYRETIRLKPDFADGYLHLGNAYRSLGHMETAIAYYKSAIHAGTHRADAFINLGVAYKAIGQLGTAIEYYEQAVLTDPGSAAAHYNLGNAYYLSGRFPEAVARFERAVALDPEDPDIHHNLAAAYRRIPRAEDAARHLVIEQQLRRAGTRR